MDCIMEDGEPGVCEECGAEEERIVDGLCEVCLERSLDEVTED
jgi:NMD protein affecting ribosome stability and mRNA decay